MARIVAFLGLAFTLLGGAAAASAKEVHFDQVRVLLISRAARCTSCHVDGQGFKLNKYGGLISKQSRDLSLADRISAVEHGPTSDMDAAEKKHAERNQDVDGDGVPNWVEILAGKDPSRKNDKPDAALATRIEHAMSCNLCHSANNLPGEGLEANPHNPFGKLLAATVGRTRGKPPRDADAVRSAAERTPILTRLSLVAGKRPKGSKATYWEKIRLFHDPSDADDQPSRDELAEFKKSSARQWRKRTRDQDHGLDTKKHPLDGFLKDADQKLP